VVVSGKVRGNTVKETAMTSFKKVSDAIQFSSEKMKKNGLFETDRFFCDLYCFEPGQEQAPHAHQGSDKVYYVVKGRGVFQVGEEERELGEGEIALAESGQKHGVTNRSNERLLVLVYMAPKPAH
jgi:quercetin dioxygenase-like cupin family protein